MGLQYDEFLRADVAVRHKGRVRGASVSRVQGDGESVTRGRDPSHSRRRVQSHGRDERRVAEPVFYAWNRQQDVLHDGHVKVRANVKLYGVRQHAECEPSVRFQVHRRFAETLGARISRRRLPFRSRQRAVPGREGTSHELASGDSSHREGSRTFARQAHRRALGLRRTVPSR